METTQALEFVECAICLEVMQDPASLMCGHSICISHCDLLKKNTNGSVFDITCPHCRQLNHYTQPISINYALRAVIQALSSNKGGDNTSNSNAGEKDNVSSVPVQRKAKPVGLIQENGIWNVETVRQLQSFFGY